MSLHNQQYKVAILDDHAMIVDLLTNWLKNMNSISSVNGYNNSEDFLNKLPETNFDILIIDILMPGIKGDEIVKACKKQAHLSHSKIIVLSSIIEYSTIKHMVDLGVAAYVSKLVSETELQKALEHILDTENAGNIYFSADIKEMLVKATGINGYNVVKLTPREYSIVIALCEGNTVKEVAQKLQLSIGSIQGYMKLIFRKMDVNRTSDLIVKAIKMGLFTP